jgi:hypothetical protein
VQAWRGGSADTTVGSSRVFSLLSIAATIARGASKSIGAEKTRTASLLQTGHGAADPAIPIGRLTSKMPSTTHRYRYIAICALSQVSCVSETGSARSVGFEWLSPRNGDRTEHRDRTLVAAETFSQRSPHPHSAITPGDALWSYSAGMATESTWLALGAPGRAKPQSLRRI